MHVELLLGNCESSSGLRLIDGVCSPGDRGVQGNVALEEALSRVQDRCAAQTDVPLVHHKCLLRSYRPCRLLKSH